MVAATLLTTPHAAIFLFFAARGLEISAFQQTPANHVSSATISVAGRELFAGEDVVLFTDDHSGGSVGDWGSPSDNEQKKSKMSRWSSLNPRIKGGSYLFPRIVYYFF